jgi:hypothetical protein
MQLGPIYRREGADVVAYEVTLELRDGSLDPALFETFRPCADENGPEACTTVRCPTRRNVLFFLPGRPDRATIEAALEFYMSGLIWPPLSAFH